jgi:transcriptional regulator with XRE-family HTH domain
MSKETPGDRIQRRREQREMTFQELAAKLGPDVDWKRVASWRGTRKPHMPMLREVAAALGTSVEWILYGKGDPDDRPIFPDELHPIMRRTGAAAAPIPPSDDDKDDEAPMATWDDTEPVTIGMVQKRKAELIAMYAALNGEPPENVKIAVTIM